MAEVEVLFHCFYIQMGLMRGHPVLSIRWPLTPMPEREVSDVYGGRVFNLGSTNTLLIRDGDVNIVVDPGIIQLGRYGAFQSRLAEFELKPEDIDIVVNTHCHYDHVECNYLFRGRRLIIHEREAEYCRRLYWPEYYEAYMGIMDVEEISGPYKISENIRILETPGHTPGSITVLAETRGGLVACVGDAVIVKEDLQLMRPPQVVTSNVSPEMAVESLKKIISLKPCTVIPGHDAPFQPQLERFIDPDPCKVNP